MTDSAVSNPAPADAPPAPTFDSLPLSQEVKRALAELGYVNPTPVQLAVFGPASEGRNLVVQARTGTGKTCAFSLPLVDSLLRRSVHAVQGLVLTPTRELAIQVADEMRKIGQHRGVRVVSIYGGAPMQHQIDELAAAPHVVVGTPGRVLDHLRRGTFDPSHVRTFVLDEADEMLSMGFARELSSIVEFLPKERQGLFFSATIPPDIERMAKEKLTDPLFVTLSSDQAGALTIDHFVYLVRDRKIPSLLKIIEVENPESAIVFCNTKDETQRVAEALQNQGFDAAWLNGDLEQKERERVMRATREGKVRFLVCTDVAARGIDISHLTHVINFDFPESAEAYVHRTGRTGRAGRTGTAISLVAPRDVGNVYLVRLSYKIRPIEKQLPTSGEMKTRAEQDVVDGFVAAYAELAVDEDALAISRRLLTHDSAQQIVAHLVRALLGDKIEDAKTSGAEARRAKNPPRIEDEPAPRPERTREPAPRAAEARPARPRGDDAPRGEARPRRNAERSVDRAAPAPGEGQGAAPQQAASSDSPTAEAAPRAERPRRERGPRRERAPREPGEDLPTIGFTESEPGAPVPAPRTVASPAPVAEVDPNVARLYVNVGRRDGLKAEDIEGYFSAAGVSQLEQPQIRDRMTYLVVSREAATTAIEALSGQSIGGRALVAELARPLGSRPSRA